MVGHPIWLYSVNQPLQTTEVVEAEWVGGPNVQRDSVQNHRIVFPDLLQNFQGSPARGGAPAHEILGDDLEPADRGPLGEHFVIVPRPEPDADALSSCRH